MASDLTSEVQAKLRDVLLEHDRERYEAGDKTALMDAIRFCAQNEEALPHWASKAFIECYELAGSLEINSWDSVFGKPIGKHAKAAPIQLMRDKWIEVGEAVFVHRLNGGKLKSEDYDEIAASHGTNRATVKQFWSLYQKYVSPDPARKVKQRTLPE